MEDASTSLLILREHHVSKLVAWSLKHEERVGANTSLTA